MWGQNPRNAENLQQSSFLKEAQLPHIVMSQAMCYMIYIDPICSSQQQKYRQIIPISRVRYCKNTKIKNTYYTKNITTHNSRLWKKNVCLEIPPLTNVARAILTHYFGTLIGYYKNLFLVFSKKMWLHIFKNILMLYNNIKNYVKLSYIALEPNYLGLDFISTIYYYYVISNIV